MPHLLLYGPPGTGKTTTILAVARKLSGSQMHNMVLELNVSDECGTDVVRQQIQNFANTQSFSFGAKSLVKLVRLDEEEAMTKDAQFAHRRACLFSGLQEPSMLTSSWTILCHGTRYWDVWRAQAFVNLGEPKIPAA